MSDTTLNVGESIVVLITDPETGATAQLTITADGIFIPAEPEPPQPIEGSARWCAPLEVTVSSRETGPIVALLAWGGQGEGYSYRYVLNGAPQGVTIDEDTGVLSIANALGVRDYSIDIVVTDRSDATLMAMFDFTLHVVEDIIHKTYRPEDFGGNLTNMQSRILSDQEAAGDGKLRARIEFKRGKTYTYTDNHWLSGVQYYECVATGSGANPKLQNTHDASGYAYDQGPLNIGKGANCFAELGAPCDRGKSALIAEAHMGDDMVRLLTAGDGNKLMLGRWHAVTSCCQQIAGYPPNVRWIDYVKVVAINDDIVTLDRPLNHAHHTYGWEDPNDQTSFGKARIGLWDGFDGKTRCTERGVWRDIEFLVSPNYTVTYIESHIHLFMLNCKMPLFVPSMNKHAELRNCTLIADSKNPHAGCAEPDKLSEALFFIECRAESYVGGVSGFHFFLTRDCPDIWPCQIACRQHRDIGSTFNAHGDNYYCVPYGGAFNGPELVREFIGTKFHADGNPSWWTWTSNPVNPLPLSASSWQGNKLIIPRGFERFEDWLVWLWEGCMLFTGATVAQPDAYGRVDKLYAAPDGSAIWCDVTWINGTKPVSGNLNIPQKALRKLIWDGVTLTAGTWQEPSYICIEGTDGHDRPFPDGIS